MKARRHESTTGRAMAAVAIFTAAAALAGCHVANVGEPLTQNLAGNEVETQMEFWHTLNDRPVTSNDEAFHGLLLFLDEKDDSADYPARVETLKSRNLLRADFDRPATEAVTRGTLAIALLKVLDIKGGLVLRVFGPTPRYATRELRHMGLYPDSSPQQTFSGAEYVGIIGRLEDFQRLKTVEPKPQAVPQPQEAAPAPPPTPNTPGNPGTPGNAPDAGAAENPEKPAGAPPN